MDKLKLDIRSMDDLHAELKVNRRPFQQQLITSQDLAEALSRLSLLPVDWQGRAKLVSWLDTLSTMQVLLFIRLVSCLVVADSFDLCRPATSWTSRKPDSWASTLSRLTTTSTRSSTLHEKHRIFLPSPALLSPVSTQPSSPSWYSWPLLLVDNESCTAMKKCGDLLRGLYKQHKNTGSLVLRLLHYVYTPLVISGIK